MRNRRAVPLLLALAIAVLAVAGCATIGGPTPAKAFADMNPKERSLYFMGTYKAQFQDAASMGTLAQQGKLSPGQLEVYRVKRKLLIQAKPLIEAYDAIAAGWGIPGAGREAEILILINQLAAAGS
ncbi:MAG TPA: hypothetical protein PK416_10690 [Thermodesulfobacteriota bacterium]|nr:hypothetical protein [Thermodesulfobacteriota bacterium]